MAKETIFTRITRLAKANINALIDKAEDPEKMLDQMIRDYTNNIREAEATVAQTIGNLRLMERDYEDYQKEAQENGTKALAASNKADTLRAAGNIAEADKFDNLAKLALNKQLQAEKSAANLEPTIASQTQVVNQLKDGLEKMRTKLDEVKYKRDELTARHKTAQAQSQVNEALKSIDVLDPTSEMSRFEEKVRREEAKVIGQQEIAASSLNNQFAALEDFERQSELDDRLAALKAKNNPTTTV
jgi:phage shock protein A